MKKRKIKCIKREDFINKKDIVRIVTKNFKNNIKRGMDKYPALQEAMTHIPPQGVMISMEGIGLKNSKMWMEGYNYALQQRADKIKDKLGEYFNDLTFPNTAVEIWEEIDKAFEEGFV